MPSVATEAIVNTTVNVTTLIGRLAGHGEKALPVVRILANFFPWGGVVVDALTIAAPYLHGASTAAPYVSAAILAGTPIYEAIEKAGPDVMKNLKAIYAIAVNHDPARVETAMTAADVSDQDAAKFAGVSFNPGWTNEETEEWWARAQGRD